MANKVTLDGGQAPTRNRLASPVYKRPSVTQAPFQARTPSSYIAPIQNYTPPPAYNPAPAQTNWGTGAATTMPYQVASFGGGGMASTASAAPAPPPEPPKPKPISEKDWLAGDTEYQNELTGYDNTLKDFLARIATQEDDFKTDYGTAMKGFGRNRDRSMLNLGEDFTSRGLANSGMFADSRTKAKTQFEDQENGLTLAKTRGLSDFGNQRSDKTRSTETQKGNARRSSLARLAQKQAF